MDKESDNVNLIDSTNSLVEEALNDIDESYMESRLYMDSTLGDDSIYVISAHDWNDDGTENESEITANDVGDICFTHCGMCWTIDKHAEHVSVKVVDDSKVYGALVRNNIIYDGTAMGKIDPQDKLDMIKRGALYRNGHWTWLNDTARKYVAFIVKLHIRAQLQEEIGNRRN